MSNQPKMTMVDMEYLQWAGKKIEDQGKRINELENALLKIYQNTHTLVDYIDETVYDLFDKDEWGIYKEILRRGLRDDKNIDKD